MRGSTFILGPSSFDRRNTGNLPFCFSLPFLFLSIQFSSVCFSSFLFFFFFSFLLFLSSELPFFGLFSLSFLFHFPFSLFFHFLFSSFSSFLFFFSFNSYPIGFYQKWGKLHPPPPPPPLPHLSSPPFFLIFLFLLFPSFDTWLNVSHSHKCTTWLMPCVTHLGFHVASTSSRHMSSNTQRLEKHEIPTGSKFDEIRQGN